MKRGKKFILLCHCVLNCNSKVEGLSTYNSFVKEVVDVLYAKDIGMIQLPCPEMHMYGIKRWGHVKDQFNTPIFRNECKNILTPILNQVRNYIDNSYELVGVIGIDGSPSCGVNLTCSGDWGGEFSSEENYKECVKTLRIVNDSGVFIEELKALLKEMNIETTFMALDEGDIKGSINNLII